MLQGEYIRILTTDANDQYCHWLAEKMAMCVLRHSDAGFFPFGMLEKLISLLEGIA
jgi:hypothetical protein